MPIYTEGTVQETQPCRTCQPSRSEFSVAFSKTHVNTGQDPLENPPQGAFRRQSQVPPVTMGLKPTTNLPTKRLKSNYLQP